MHIFELKHYLPVIKISLPTKTELVVALALALICLILSILANALPSQQQCISRLNGGYLKANWKK